MIKYSSKIKEEIYMIINEVKNEKEAKLIFNKIKTVANKHIPQGIKLEFLGYIEKNRIISETSKTRELFVKKEPMSKPSLQIVEIVKKITKNRTKEGKNIEKNSSISSFFKKILSNF